MAVRPNRARAAASVVALVLVTAGCSDDTSSAGGGRPSTIPSTTSAVETTTSTTEPPDTRAWPDPDWSTTSAGEAGIDQASLDSLAVQAEAAGSQCLVVTRDGELVGEWYWGGADEDTEREAFSVTKSVTATLVGIAADQGHLDIDQPASDFITEWQGTPSEPVTIRNLISNDSGRYHDVATDYLSMASQAADKTAFSIELDQQHEPGTTWVYNNAAIQTLEAVLERATGMPVGDFAEENLFSPIGMDSRIATDPAGNTLTFMGLQTTCRDLARFGLLYLRDGEWQGEQVVSESFVEEAVEPSQDVNPEYGFLWWIIGEDGGETAPGQGDLPEAGPSGYAALGLGDQVLAVYPEDGLVVTRLGNANGGFGVAQITEWAATVE